MIVMVLISCISDVMICGNVLVSKFLICVELFINCDVILFVLMLLK